MRSFVIAVLCSTVFSAAAVAQAPAPARPDTDQRRPPATRDERAIVVTGNRQEVVARPDRLSFSIANDLQAQTGTLADALRNVPGVEVDLDGNVSLRGDSSVEILVDGRPSAMLRGDGRAAAIQSMPASQIERVEVITNPSAAFSPEGTGGIINLVTKRGPADSRWATIRAVAGPDGKAGANLAAATSRKGLTISGDLGLRRWPFDSDFKRTRQALAPGGSVVSTSRQTGDIEQRPIGLQGRLGAEYDLDKANRLSAELSFHRMEMKAEREELTISTNPALGLLREAQSNMTMGMVAAKASWRRQFAAEHELVVELDHSRFAMDSDSDGRLVPALDPLRFERIGNDNDRAESGFKIDYKKPLGEKSSLNFGYEVDLERNDYDLIGAFGDSPATLLPLPALTNRFAYNELINAFYATATFTLGKLELQPGLRFEHADLEIDQKTDELRIDDAYARLYPTLHLGYSLSQSDRLRASFSRRIARPAPQSLNPYTIYVDPQNLRRGNPFLRPSVTDSFEIGWNRRKGSNFLSAMLFHRRSRDGFTEVIEDLGGGILLTTSANLAREKRTGLELIANGKIGKTLGYNASATILHLAIDSAGSGFFGKRDGTSANGRLSLTWQPTAKDFFQLGGFYAGRQLLPQGYRRPGGMLNLGYRRKVSEKLSLLLTGQNLLDSLRSVTVIEGSDFRDRFVNSGPGRTVLAGVTLNLGTGNRRRQDQGIDFDQGSNIPQ